MYICTDCGRKFEKFDLFFEEHGFDEPPFEGVAVCPFCNSSKIKENKIRRCHHCGIILTDRRDFCSDSCRNAGMKLWRYEQRRRRRNAVDPINMITLELEDYNRRNKTCYTYGQYVARILPSISGKGGH